MSEKQRKNALKNAKEKVMFHQDNAPCHKSMKTIVKLNELHFEFIYYSLCSQDLASSDDWLFSENPVEDVRLSESDCKEYKEKTNIIDYIPVNPDIYIARDDTEGIPHNSNAPGRFATRNVLQQSSGPTSFAKHNVNISFL
ncbi:uncharacterized protein TNCV_1736421 [Trichonephila clavipes]|nr:uncharacterized protein TNCV_1736421 [Trichonephila clavipes]